MKLHEWQEKQKIAKGGEIVSFSYYDKDGKVKKDLFDKMAEEEAKKWASARDRRGKPELSNTQVRKFYNEIKAIERYIELKGEENFEQKLPEIKMIKAKAAYAYGRKLQKKGGSITREFKDFLDKHIGQINTYQDFKIFCKFFEAVVGFFEFYSQPSVRIS